MRATDLLMDEHLLINRGIAVLLELAARVQAGKPVPEGAIPATLQFLSEFADKHHHGKEEAILFPALVEAGFPQEGGPVGVMLHEHDLGRSFQKRMRAALPDLGDPGARNEFAEAARGYAALLDAHIHKENEVLFRMAEQAIEGPERRRVEEEFDNFENAAAEVRARFEKSVGDLERQLR